MRILAYIDYIWQVGESYHRQNNNPGDGEALSCGTGILKPKVHLKKRPCIQNKTPLRFKPNAKAFHLKRKGVF